MGTQILGYPRKQLSTLDLAIRDVKTLIASGASVSDGDKGDIEVSGTGTVWRVEGWGGRTVVGSTAELEAAVASLPSTGGIIYMGPGNFDLTPATTLVFNNPNFALVGAGNNVTFLRQSDVNTDIISIRRGRAFLSGFTVMHGTSLSAAAGVAGFGRGIVIEALDSVFDNIVGVWLHDLNFVNTANWSIYDTGNYNYDVLATPIGESPTYGYDTAGPTSLAAPIVVNCTTNGTTTVTSAAAFGSVRVNQVLTGTGIPHNTRVVAKASNSSLTISHPATDSTTTNRNFSNETECSVSVGLHIDHCDVSFPQSGGCIFVGYGSTTTRISALKTNSYSYGSYTTHFGGAADSVTVGGVHVYGNLDCVFDQNCTFQSPSDDGTHDDKDATMASFHQCNGVSLYTPYAEVLSTNCIDANAGAGGRQYWLFTSLNCSGISVHNCLLQSIVTNPAVTDEGYPMRIWKTPTGTGGSEVHFHEGLALNRRLYYNTTTRPATAPTETGDFVTPWDRDDFVFQNSQDGSTIRPISIDELQIVNYVGGGRRPPAVPTGAGIANRNNFRIVNANRNFRFSFWRDNDMTGATTGVEDIRARTALAHEFKSGIAGYVTGDTGGNGRRQREGLWIVAARGSDFKQVPFWRVHSSQGSNLIASDLWMETANTTGANNDWRDARFHWYHNGAWQSVVGIERNTTVADNLPVFTDTSNTVLPKSIVVDSAGDVVTSAGNVVFA